MSEKYPGVIVDAEMIRASMVKDDTWIRARQAEVDVEMKRVGEKINEVFDQMRGPDPGRRRIDRLAQVIGKMIRRSPRLGRRAR